MATAKTKRKAEPVEEDELEELEESETSTEAAKEDEIWGISNGLIPLIKEKLGKDYTPREVRTLLRKMAREDGTVDREVIPGNKSRYSWSGPKDPEVIAILKEIKGGAIEASKKAALDKLKADKAAKAPKPEAKAAKAKATKKAAPPVDDDDDLDELEDDDD